MVSSPKAKGLYRNFTLYDIRHNSACFWFNRYPTQKGLMYRFGWKNPRMIEYYSGFLGAKDEITDTNMILGEEKTKLVQLEQAYKDLKENSVSLDVFERMIEERNKFGDELVQLYRPALEKLQRLEKQISKLQKVKNAK